MIKHLGKSVLCALLERQIKQLRKRHQFSIVAVCGSVGKTSTKLAIAQTLAFKQRVIYQDGNYNDRLTVPLVLFGHTEPHIFNAFAWLRILASNAQKLRKSYDYDIAVLELGSDAPGQLKAFEYLQPEILIVTAVAAEHMEYFGSLGKVAEEELTPIEFSKRILINLDDVPAHFLPQKVYMGYGENEKAVYRLQEIVTKGLQGQEINMLLGIKSLRVQTQMIGKSISKSFMAAAAVADLLGWDAADIQAGLQNVTHVPGRMQILEGANGSVLIDDTYNASPIAAKAALGALYAVDAKQRIAILGTMNELGDTSQTEHENIGAHCDPAKLDLVVTIGKSANEYLATAAEKAGCKVARFDSPYEAGAYVKTLLSESTIVLAKGSQNGVFAEEALKQLLANPDDRSKLVRQSPYWLSVKQKQFPQR